MTTWFLWLLVLSAVAAATIEARTTYNNGSGLPTLTIKLNTGVTQIVWPQNPNEKVVVTIKQGDRYTADNVLMTASVEVLKESANMEYDTIVIGMGAAGTTAASKLALAGKKVLGLDAMDRIGGRVHTVPFGDGVVELGAEWIHGTHPSSVYDIAVEHNVTLAAQNISMEIFYSDGSFKASELDHELLACAMQAVDQPPPRPMPLGHHITSKVMEYIKEKHPSELQNQDYIDDFLAFADLMIDNYEATDSWNDITTASNYQELEGHQHMSWHWLGYKTLFEILLNTYNNGPGLPTLTIKLNTEVTQIVWPQNPNDKVVVTTKQGDRYTADNVIVTVSVGVLKERHASLFSPPLPQPKVDAITHLTMGVLGKVILLFPSRWWPQERSFYGFMWVAEDKRKVTEDTWTLRLQLASNPMGASHALTVWTSGAVGRLVETLPDDVVKRKCMEILRRFMGNSGNLEIPEPIGMLRSGWYSNPYTRGSYTYDNLDAPKYPTARSDLAEPLKDSAGRPRVLFAGEATEPNHFSTVHGAVDSGKREANRLLPSSKI